MNRPSISHVHHIYGVGGLVGGRGVGRGGGQKEIKNLGRLVGYPSAKMDGPKRQETKVKQMAVYLMAVMPAKTHCRPVRPRIRLPISAS